MKFRADVGRAREGRPLLPGAGQRRRPRRPPVVPRGPAPRHRRRSPTRARRAGSRPTSPRRSRSTAGQTYIASYFAPAGGYSATRGAFGPAGVDRGVLHLLRSAGSGGNGVFRYGSSGFPLVELQRHQLRRRRRVHRAARHHRPGRRRPRPGAAGWSAWPGARPCGPRFDEAITPGSLSITLAGPSGTVAGDGRLRPGHPHRHPHPDRRRSPRATAYTATVSAADTHGNAMPAPFTWAFTTVTPAGSTPATHLGQLRRPRHAGGQRRRAPSRSGSSSGPTATAT